MTYTIDEIATALGATAEGDTSLVVTGAAAPDRAGPDQIALALSPAYGEALAHGQATSAVVWPDADWRAMGLQAAIFAPRGRLAMSGLTRIFDETPGFEEGVHPTAAIDGTATLGASARVGAFAFVGAAAVIGPGARIGPHVTIGPGVKIGQGAILHAGVRIQAGVEIGDRFIAQPGAVVGGDGFSFVTETPSGAEQARSTLGATPVEPPEDPTWRRIHSLGGVVIGNDVEMGTNSTIDAGTVAPTTVGDGTKIDNLVQIGHNVRIGQHCLLCSQAGVAGSVEIGDRVILGGKTGISDNISIGDDVVTGGASIVLSSVPAGRVVLGYPATRMDRNLESYKALRRLPRVLKRLGAVPSDD